MVAVLRMCPRPAETAVVPLRELISTELCRTRRALPEVPPPICPWLFRPAAHTSKKEQGEERQLHPGA